MKKTIVFGDTKHSKLIVKDTSIIVVRNESIAGKDKTGIVNIMGNLSIEVGRPIKQFLDASANSRSPILMKTIITKGAYKAYDVTRINTGKVPSTRLGTIETFKGTIVGYIYDRRVLKDKELLKFIKAPAINRLSINVDGKETDRMEHAIKSIVQPSNIEIVEVGNIVKFLAHSKLYKAPIEYRATRVKGKLIITSIVIPSYLYR